MPTTTLLPVSEGTNTGATLVSGANKTVAVQTADDLTSYVSLAVGSAAEQDWYVDPLPGYAGEISSVVHGMRAAGIGGVTNGQARPRIRLGGNTVDGTLRVAPTSGWTNYSEALTRPGGGSFTVNDFPGGGAGCQVAAREGSGADANFGITYIHLDVTWSPAGNGFVCLVGSLAGAALGLAEMAGLARALHRRTGTLITPDEYLAAWRDIRGHRRPVTLLLGGAR